jgi:hypothetical protein
MRLFRFSFFVVLTLAFCLSVFWHPVRASINENVRGLADSSQGYISFNCLDDDFAGVFPFTFEFRFNVPPCSFSQHGVNLDIDNNFSGLAWNPTLGFIDFGATSTPPDNYAFNVNCLSTCNAGNSCSACYNENNQRVYGWAKVISNNSWIELNSVVSPQTSITNYLAPTPGIFSGYASSSIGSIRFNCSDNSSCGTFDHKVYIWKLELTEMSAPNWSFNDACTSGARKIVFKWLRRSGTQTAYRVIVNTVNSTSTPVFDSGTLTGSAAQLVCPGPLCGFTPEYNTTYYWWLQLWNQDNEATELFQFNTNTYGNLTDNVAGNNVANPDDANLTFTAYKHEFPIPYFTWSPFEILVGTSTDFSSNSRYYTTASPNSNSQLCVDGNCQFLWTASDPAALIANATRSTTSIVFANLHPQSVSLRVTDADLYTCSTSSPLLSINFALPLWKEVKAE